MFNKRKCKRCEGKIKKEHSFCPYCGHKIYAEKKEKNDWGILGKDDQFIPEEKLKLPLGFDSILGSMIKGLTKELNSQMKKDFENSRVPQGKNFTISITTRGNSPRIKMNNPKVNVPKKKKKKIKQNFFSNEKLEKFSSLPREEPQTNVRRFSDKLIYELETEGIKTKEDISVVKLEKSVEIRAISEKKSYMKILPVALPIEDYYLENEKIILEFELKN